MSARQHTYTVDVVWRGNLGTGTSAYRDYSRNHEVRSNERPMIPGSADPMFLGDPSRWNPEQLLVSALSQCHMLWFLHLASASGVVIVGYHDRAEGSMRENADGSGEFIRVRLRPEVIVADESMVANLDRLHQEAHQKCFVARSVNFPVTVDGTARADQRRGSRER